MLKENRTTTENEDSWTDRLKNKEINVILCFSFIVLSIYIYLVSIMYRDILNPYDIKLIFQGNDSSTIENISEIEDFKSSILTLYFFLILSLISKSIAMKFFIPSYIGSMIIGMTLQNVEYLKSVFIIFPYYLEVTRLSAVIFVLLRTSLTINYNELKKYWKKAFFAGVPPTILGYISLILLTYFLFKTPLIISLSYAFVIGATGPAVPLFMSKILIDKKLGLRSGIGQIWRLSTNYAFSFNNYSFLHSLVHIVLGIGIGFLFSIIYWYYPFNTNLPFFSTTRTLMILGSCGGLLFYFKTIGYYSTPVIGILIFSFIAGIKYKRDSTDGIYSNEHSYIDNLWFNIFEPFLFIITGYHCDFRNYNWVNFINSLLIVIFAILTKILFGIISTWFLKLKRNEKIFLSLSLIPRSSIQAANAIMIMNLTNDSEISKDGKNFYLTTITSLLLPAIFSQWIYYYLGNKLLKRFTIDDLKIQNVVVLEDKNSI